MQVYATIFHQRGGGKLWYLLGREAARKITTTSQQRWGE